MLEHVNNFVMIANKRVTFFMMRKQSPSFVYRDKLASFRIHSFVVFRFLSDRMQVLVILSTEAEGEQSSTDVKHEKTFWLNDSTTQTGVHFIVFSSRKKGEHCIEEDGGNMTIKRECEREDIQFNRAGKKFLYKKVNRRKR